MKVAAILQARMGSSRLPGKILRQVLGTPLLAYELHRLQYCKRLDSILVATSESPQDDATEALVQELGFPCFRGSEEDVLDRYYQAALSLGLTDGDHIVRITGDCPLIDPTICDALIQDYFEHSCEFAVSSARFAEGLDCEIFSFSALTNAWKNARRPSEREHVTMHMNNNPALYNKHVFENTEDHSAYRITVDEAADFAVVEAILTALVPIHGTLFGFSIVKQYLDEHPDIFAKNSTIIRNEGLIKSLNAEKYKGDS